ncbi:MAG: hydantoinase B/oxoprolinase family protein [Candidatus Marinimicrobia bacterium]|nr:hydantoinase B/oxoprolinase family protein [Candidatus Neomarinimicrobiota bacterium]
MSSQTAPDPVTLELFRNLYQSVAEEMGISLCRTSFSPNIKERRDYSCALFDGAGRLVAQGDHMPVHLGSMPLSVAAALEKLQLKPGDVAALNDPFYGGTHLPDITMVQPVYLPGADDPSFYVANRAHHSDVGGMTPGSMPLASSIFQEGLRIPPVRLVRGGRMDADVLSIILTNVRTPVEREGDLTAQLAANKTGERRLLAIAGKMGMDLCDEYMLHLQNYGERVMRASISEMPNGEYRFEDVMDDDGYGNGPLPICAKVTIHGDEATIDFSGTAGQTTGGINANYAITLSATYYCFRALISGPAPSNAGTMQPLTIIAPEGSLVNAQAPAAVAAGNVETSQRIVDVVFGALAQALPDKVPAASYGTMNNLTVGGIDPRSGQPYAYYETIAGGMGARPTKPGLSATHCHMTNSLNTPIEALEHAYPFRIEHYAIRKNSGGRGRFAGGDGIDRAMTVLGDAEITVLSDRREKRPWGLAGGDSGAAGANSLIMPGGEVEIMPGKFSRRVPAGTTVRIQSPGGGGYGKRE